jgi:hypothetical protein
MKIERIYKDKKVYDAPGEYDVDGMRLIISHSCPILPPNQFWTPCPDSETRAWDGPNDTLHCIVNTTGKRLYFRLTEPDTSG